MNSVVKIEDTVRFLINHCFRHNKYYYFCYCHHHFHYHQQVFVFLGPWSWPRTQPLIGIYQTWLSIYIFWSCAPICIYRAWSSICVGLFFVLQLNFAIATMSSYVNSASTFCSFFLGKMWEISNLQLFEISSQKIFWNFFHRL